VDDQPAGIRIGTVVFSDSGFTTQRPTYDRAEILAAIDRLAPERGTSLGSGIIAALQVLAEDDAPETDYYTTREAGAPAEPTPRPTPVPDGYVAPAVVVLLTDGEHTVDPAPAEAAVAAKERGVRVDTVGIGTTDGITLEVEGFSVHSALDEAALQEIAAVTGGTYYPAADYDDVGARFVVRQETFELTPVFAAVGFVLLLVGAVASLRWVGRVP
jgi:Ca-activated chloride channel family protein